jgi:threonine aldolase
MDFRSDNVAGVAPEILAAILEANQGTSSAYGNDALSQRLDSVLSDVFETRVKVFPVATGTAANALALSALAPPFGAIYCHSMSHIMNDECGAPEFFTGGAKLRPMEGALCKIAAEELDRALASEGNGDVHNMQPAAISISQTSERGTVYDADEIAAIGRVARRHRVGFHMDGTRFAYAIAASGAKPKDMTWKAGVDVLSLGATKNGALAAEAVVFFDEKKAAEFGYRRKRGGQLLSKGRFVSAQLLASFSDGLWLRLAATANTTARRLSRGLERLGVPLAFPNQANAVFAVLPKKTCAALREIGFEFYDVDSGDPVTVRLMASFSTKTEDVDRLIEAVGRLKSA